MKIDPSPQAKHAPIGTRVTPAQPLTEQRTAETFHQSYPWPDWDGMRLQRSLLDYTPMRRPGLLAWVYAVALASFLAVVRWAA